MNTTISQLSPVIPATRLQQQTMTEAFVSQVTNGDINPVEAVIQMKSLLETINAFLKDERVKEAVLNECENYGKGEYPSFRGAVLQVKETAVKYDFLACGDPVYTNLLTTEQEVSDSRKEREKYLRSITKPKSEIDEETGEVYTLLPPPRQSTTSYAITFKKE